MLTLAALILTDLTLHPEHFGNLVDADQRRVSDVSQDVGENAGSFCPARRTSILLSIPGTLDSGKRPGSHCSSPFCVDVRGRRFHIPELPRAPAGQIRTDPVPLHHAPLFLLVLLHAVLHLALFVQLVFVQRLRFADEMRAE